MAAELIGEYIRQNNAKKAIILALLEPRTVDPEGWAQLQAWQREYPSVKITDFSTNPIALFLFFRHHRKQLTYVGPQFHAILAAHIAGVRFMPLAYDNKVSQLLTYLGRQPVPIGDVSAAHLEAFFQEAEKVRA